MAKIYSHSESRAKGSVGMTTYRTVRGKVIQSQKISPWDPAVEAVGGATRWNERTALLGIISLWASAHGQSIVNSFNRTKNGSQRNYFMKRNYAALKAAFYNLSIAYAASKVAPTIQAIEDALGAYAALHPNTIYRIKKSGYDIVFLANNWNDANDPVAPAVVNSMSYLLDGDYNLLSVSMIGSGLSSSVALSLDGAPLDGVMSVGAGGASASFAVNGTVLVRGDKSLTAKVGDIILNSVVVSGDQRPYFTLGLLVDPIGGGSVTGAGTFVADTSAPINAVAAPGYRFLQWSDENPNASRSVSITENITLTAEFESLSTPVSYGSNGNSRILLNGNLEPANITRGLLYTLAPQLDGAEVFGSWHATNGFEGDSLDAYIGNVSESSTTFQVPAEYDGDTIYLILSVD